MNNIYTRINQYMKSHEGLTKGIILTDKLCTISMLAFYPLLLLWLLFYGSDTYVFMQCIIIPAVGFIIVTVFRRIYHAKRPYEMYDITPLNGKTTAEKSFPSRHVFSIFMIAETVLYVTDSPISAIFYILGLLLAVSRVMLGVHFIKDVSCGALFALICGVFFYM